MNIPTRRNLAEAILAILALVTWLAIAFAALTIEETREHNARWQEAE